jgi:hypothetical protein
MEAISELNHDGRQNFLLMVISERVTCEPECTDTCTPYDHPNDNETDSSCSGQSDHVSGYVPISP